MVANDLTAFFLGERYSKLFEYLMLTILLDGQLWGIGI